MAAPDPKRVEDEIERLRQALELETQDCHELRRQLGRANAEFEEFVSMTAHNLRESLRDIASYSQLMAETDAGEYLARIQEGAAKGQSLLGDVVDYWANCTGSPPPGPADMEAVLRVALLSIDALITERCASITHDPLPAVTGDFEVLVKVMRHLVRNAVEYCDSPAPRVHISSKRVDLEWIFSVQDHGPGIDPAFHGHLFKAFRRLHGKEYPGSGLGLAFCRKAIAWQGGRIWVESTLGVGLTFHFTLPAAE